MNLANKVVIVTGASAGIGLEIALALAREGARVAFAARREGKLREAVERATLAGGVAAAAPVDVTSDASVAAAVAAVEARLGPVDVLVNNAGDGGNLGPWAGSDALATRALFDVHVLGAERMTRAVLPSMLSRGSGTVVNVASAVAWVPMPGAAAYSAAKAAVVALSSALRAELAGAGVDVRVFAPPHTSTESAWPLDLPKVFAPEWVAQEFVRALRGDRARVVAGGNELLLLIQRLSPALAARIMNRLGFKVLAKVSAAPAPPPG